ncbi:recombinase family protein, partial [Thalassospira alkalitolerans]|uniref:recombinase family protein n=1 Tax=Thalassospira alkalitolerans TaxID=1293890 RepID=UPI00111C2DE5
QPNTNITARCEAMLETSSSGGSVAVFKLDRLGRSVLHLADLLVRFEHESVHFVSLSEGINTTTPGSKLVLHIFSAMAEFQREIIVENTCAGIDAARQRGVILGRPRTLTPEDIAEAHRQIMQGHKDMEQIANLFDIHPKTVERAFEREGLAKVA